MKITYNFNQEFELVEVDMNRFKLIFKTNDGMNKFENSYIDFEKDKDGNTIFEFNFDNIIELQNIIKLLWDYLEENNLMYWAD